MAEWGFYGRRRELAEIDAIIGRGRYFFCAISGRRRIGKTSLIQEALKRRVRRDQAIYVQIPDSDERGVVQAFEDAAVDYFKSMTLEQAESVTRDFMMISALLGVLWNRQFTVILDEFQYFHRKQLSEFTSHLQSQVDRARAGDGAKGGLFTLGSIHTEMTALLEDRDAPLFNRVTDRITIGHWDTETLFEMFRAHEVVEQHQRLFLWSIFEGVPKFYRDCFDQGVLTPNLDYRGATLRRMFFEGGSPLRDEADNWFLRELRGRYDSVLNLIARLGPVSHGQLSEEYRRTGPDDEKQLGGYMKALTERYAIVERQLPILAPEKARRSRYRITDNFLAAWLAALRRNVQLARIRPVEEAVAKADVALQTHEGFAFEKFVRQTTEECSRKGRGDFAATELVRGYWDKAQNGDIEIDLVAIDEDRSRIRFGSCKRSAARHDAAARRTFDGHVGRFLSTQRRFDDWTVEKALYAPAFPVEMRQTLESDGYRIIDMDDFERWLA